MRSEQYQRTARALARETEMNPASAARIEAALLSALAFSGRSRPGARTRTKRFVWRRATGEDVVVGWRSWVPAAAAVLLVVAGVFVWEMNRPNVIRDGFVEPRDIGPTALAPAVSDRATDLAPVSPTKTSSTRRPHAHTPAAQNVIQPSGFVELPWSAGLPAFESGEIVRMEVPVASLPAYGIDISSGIGSYPVQADVLIGQDGLARAIRFVTTDRSTQ